MHRHLKLGNPSTSELPLASLAEASRRCLRSPLDATAVIPQPQALALLLRLLNRLFDALHDLVDREARRRLAGWILDEGLEEGRGLHHPIRREVGVLDDGHNALRADFRHINPGLRDQLAARLRHTCPV